MLLTITPNPAIDHSLWLPRLNVGQVNRAKQVHLAAGGKGINVYRAGLTLGMEAVLTGPLAGVTGSQIAELAKAEKLRSDWFRAKAGESRTCLLIHHEKGDSTVINQPGPEMDGEDWFAFVNHCLSLAKNVAGVCLCGSFPPELPLGAADHLVSTLSRLEIPVLVDTSGVALEEVLGGEGLVKVNQRELNQALHWEGRSDDWCGLFAAYREAGSRKGKTKSQIEPLIVTSGSEGAVWLSKEGLWLASAPATPVVSSVGSGDAFLAGVAAALLQELDPQEMLRWGVAAGTANLATELPARFDKSAFSDLLPSIAVRRIRE